MKIEPLRHSRLAQTQRTFRAKPLSAQRCLTPNCDSPVEMLLEALKLCLVDTYRLYGEAMNIPLDGIEIEIEGAIDLRGRFAVDDGVRPGFKAIRTRVVLDSPAHSAELERLRCAVEEHCPVLHVLRHVTPVGVTVDRIDPRSRTPVATTVRKGR